jgi:hypothetical protein
MPVSHTLATSAPHQASDATRLRVLAGTPHSRRGSVLVLVVGVLALLAIIIVVYTSVGQADVRGGRALVNQARLDDQSRAMSEHIRSIVGEDATAVRVQRVYTGQGAPSYYAVRETVDYPYTDPASRGVLTLGGVNPDSARFNPAGNITNAWTNAGSEDPRVTSDPYLATTEPTWSNRDLNRLPNMPTPFALMGHHRDWGHLSIISPSGLPVNLANLRGQFNAASGFTTAGPYSNSATPSMSDWMYVWNRVSAASGFNAAPGVAQVTPVDKYNSPATWSNDRLETFRPTTWNPGNLAAGDVKFMGNMFADADGDGWYDSLWQELVDISDPANPSNLLQGGTGVRWVVAPRIIDLSGLVNVNIATSLTVPPDIENPPGITPSDVDLERLLTMADARQYFGVHPDAHWVDAGNYSDPLEITRAGFSAFSRIIEGRLSGMAETDGNDYYDTGEPNIVTPAWLASIGVKRNGGGVTLGSVTRATLYAQGGKDQDNGQLRTDATGAYLKQSGGFGFGDELELRAFGAVNDGRTISRLETAANSDFRYALMSPLRSLRDSVTDRDAGNLASGLVTWQGETLPRSMAQYFTDPRHLLTTLSGSRPLSYSHRRLNGPNDPATSIWYPLLDGSAATSSALNPVPQSDVAVDINPLLLAATSNTPQANRGIYPLSAANEIFSNYALALSPYLGDPLVWNDAQPGLKRAFGMSFGGPTYKTATTGVDVGETDTAKFRGRAAEVALRTAAHLTLNLLASQDNSRVNAGSATPDNRPIAATLLLDNSKRGNVLGDTIGGVRAFPYWPQALNTRLTVNSTIQPDLLGTTTTDVKAYPLDLDMGIPTANGGALAGENGTNEMATGYALNLFAAQPQPFVTAAMSYEMYYDAPLANGGDSKAVGSGSRDGEWETIVDPMSGAVIGTRSLGITIDGSVTTGNHDFLMECVAFQVTNPFDVSITLGDASGGFSYYFEFAGKYYEAARYNDAGVRTGSVTLLPRQSVCFYVLSDTVANIQQRWRNADAAISNTAVKDWLNKQLTPLAINSTLPIHTMQIDPTNGATVDAGSFHESIDSSATTDANKVVRLWRVVRQATGEAVNNRANDYLVDRLHDPDYGTGNRAALYRRLDSGNNRFEQIDAGPEPSEPEYTGRASQRDNTGFSITLFGTIRRRTDPNGGPLPAAASAADTDAGTIPAWCVEPKHAYGFTVPSTTGAPANSGVKNVVEVNAGFTNSGSLSGVSRTDFINQPGSADTFRRMLTKGITGAGYTAGSKHPASRHTNGTATDITDNVISTDFAGITWDGGHKASLFPIYPRRTGATINTEVERPPLRPADLLLPWAVGPYQNPTAAAAVAGAEQKLEVGHTTLSEAIAFGLNYSRGTSDDSYEFQIGQVLDRGHLPTDRYVPYNDINSDGAWTYNNGNPDPSISNGVPFALNILDRFRTTRYGTIDSAMQGKVNVNTAPLNVLRQLPMLTPASANLYGDDNLAFKGHWMNGATSQFALKIKDENGATTTQSLWKASNDRFDAAAAIAAYRDKQATVVRGFQKDESGVSRVYVDFSPLNDGKAATALDFRGSRAFMTNCVNVRTEPGFKTPGEIALAVIQDNSVRDGSTNLNAAQMKQLGVDHFNADDNVASPSNFQVPVTQINDTNALGVTQGTGAPREQAIGLTGNVTLRPATVGPGNHFVHGGKSSDYDRKLALIDALLNTVSTRSDYFCAYFLVNGYTEGDVQGLEPWTGGGAAPNEDRYTRPMTPSVQRRYMMVLDRSQCTRPGDKPKVLMFEELPVK